MLHDEIIRTYTTLHTALPRESASKEVDAAVLSVISYPAFAIHDSNKINKTRSEIIKKLGGRYGLKRFLRDGHQTVLEDTSRLHYDPAELKKFEGIESEWPLFFTYLILDGLFRGDFEQVEDYRMKLEPILLDSSHIPKYSNVGHGHICSPLRMLSHKNQPQSGLNMKLVPELYIVPCDKVSKEKEVPGSQERDPNENIPLVWAQSLYILGNLIYDDLLSPSEVDPLGRRLLSRRNKKMDVVVQVVLLSESPELQSKLRMFGLETQLVEDCQPVTISPPSALRDALTALGESAKLGLTGRPPRPVGSLSTCKLYRCQGRLYSFLPHFMDSEEFYLVSDNDYLITVFEQELAFIKSNWHASGRPTMVVKLTEQMLGALRSNKNQRNTSKRNLFNFMMSLRSGVCGGVRVRLGRMSEHINTACIDSLDFLTSSESENWHSVLSGGELESQFKLQKAPKMAEESTSANCQTLPRKRRTVRRSMSEHSTSRGCKSPLTKPLVPEYDDDGLQSEFQLKGIDDEAEERRGRSHNSFPRQHEFELSHIEQILMKPSDSNDSPVLVLTLADATYSQEAIKVLRSSTNLYDQIDLLHYLHSCHGPSFLVPGLSTIAKLLEEVYVKATHLRQWSVVRQAAGLLRKVVNNLSINISDLLIRQKPITVGFGDLTCSITSPMSPSVLSEIIYKNWYVYCYWISLL